MIKNIISYDLCIAWNWEYDFEFVMLLDKACQSQGMSLLQITPDNLAGMMQSLINNRIAFRAFFDRASDADVRFAPIAQLACDHRVYRINPNELTLSAGNKADMHSALISAGLHTPYTIILPPYNEQTALPIMNLRLLGDSFNIKPAHGGGGEGVVIKATSWNQVLAARKEYPYDKYLLQAYIIPTQLDSRSAWFRVIYCAGQIYPCWWDPYTHVYARLTSAEEALYNLTKLRKITTSIYSVCRLELFSTEIALTSYGLFVVVDYVNDQIDLRLQSKASDGVPDDIVRDIAERLVALVAEHCSSPRGCKND